MADADAILDRAVGEPALRLGRMVRRAFDQWRELWIEHDHRLTLGITFEDAPARSEPLLEIESSRTLEAPAYGENTANSIEPECPRLVVDVAPPDEIPRFGTMKQRPRIDAAPLRLRRRKRGIEERQRSAIADRAPQFFEYFSRDRTAAIRPRESCCSRLVTRAAIRRRQFEAQLPDIATQRLLSGDGRILQQQIEEQPLTRCQFQRPHRGAIHPGDRSHRRARSLRRATPDQQDRDRPFVARWKEPVRRCTRPNSRSALDMVRC